MVLLDIATGTVLILLGMRYVRKGLDRLFGSRLIDWLQQMAKNRFQAFLAGAVAGAIAPSSSAIAMLSVQILNQTALTAGRMLAVVLGANVGITVSVQLLAFRLQDYSGFFLILGVIGFLFLKRPIFRGVGQLLLGIGLVFLAMAIIGAAGSRASANKDLHVLFGVVDHYPLVVFFATALLTVVLQSSTASIGLGIGLAQTGLLPAVTMVPWVLGANLGITLTMMIAGWGSVEGRRLAIGSLLIKSCGAALLLIGSSNFFASLLQLLPGEIDRKAANLHTLFNLVLGIAALPLLSPISRFLGFVVESQPIDDSAEPDSYLDPLLLQAPSLALNQAAREELRLMDEIKLMLRTVWMMLYEKNNQLMGKIEVHQARTEQTQDELKEYLSQVSDENLSEADIDWKLTILDYSQELTNIGILVRRDLCDAVLRHIHWGHELPAEDRGELEALYARTLERIERAALILMTRDPKLAEQFIREKEEINTQFRKSRKARLERPMVAHNASSNVFDMINCLRRINSQLTSLAYALARDSPGPERAHGQGPDIEGEDIWSPETSGKERERSE